MATAINRQGNRGSTDRRERRMALTQCRECGRDVSTEAASCPHCGAPKPTVAVTAASPPSSPAVPGRATFSRPPAPAPAPRPAPDRPRPAPGPRSADPVARLIKWGVLVLLGIIVVWAMNSQSGAARALFFVAALVAGVIVYFYPTIVAYRMRHTNTAAIFVLNLLLGWTIVGWAVALTWAVKKVER